MEGFVCNRCGANEFSEEDGYLVCKYCGTRFPKPKSNTSESVIELGNDVKGLLQKCKDDPLMAKKYAELVLEIDPNNKEAKSYLYPQKQTKGSSTQQGCYIATAVYGSYDCPEVWVLRRYRDFILVNNALGKAFIKVYYALSPSIVRLFGKRKWFVLITKKPIDILVAKLRKKGISSSPYND